MLEDKEDKQTFNIKKTPQSCTPHPKSISHIRAAKVTNYKRHDLLKWVLLFEELF